ncbi:MAG TPA: hypothetical protein VGV64_05790 [Thermoplasmata archaeon]|nr:hypothetical protein [Thermoplasmata archaeon]
MFRDGKIVCDSCQTDITRVTPPPEGGWPNLHALCSSCFLKLAQKG